MNLSTIKRNDSLDDLLNQNIEEWTNNNMPFQKKKKEEEIWAGNY